MRKNWFSSWFDNSASWIHEDKCRGKWNSLKFYRKLLREKQKRWKVVKVRNFTKLEKWIFNLKKKIFFISCTTFINENFVTKAIKNLITNHREFQISSTCKFDTREIVRESGGKPCANRWMVGGGERVSCSWYLYKALTYF